ncbi:hypothetical protein KEM56_000505 [Ascosphaera pollenicola]|nr:hypothetical protein KEM56_000505 [Ascosphaera pollenicola]
MNPIAAGTTWLASKALVGALGAVGPPVAGPIAGGVAMALVSALAGQSGLNIIS